MIQVNRSDRYKENPLDDTVQSNSGNGFTNSQGDFSNQNMIESGMEIESEMDGPNMKINSTRKPNKSSSRGNPQNNESKFVSKKKSATFDSEVIEKEYLKQSMKEAKQKEEQNQDQSQNPNVKKKYTSRRRKQFEDSESDIDSNDEEYLKKADGNKDTGEISYQDTKGNVTIMKPNIRFTSYKSVFKDLLKQTSIITMWPIVNVIINYDSTRAITTTKKDDRTYYIKMYDLESYNMTFEEKIGGGPNNYIKLKEVQQNQHGSEYAIVYFDDGKFYLRTFTKAQRNQQEIDQNQVDINKLLGINNFTMVNECFPEPYITCCFVGDDKVFIDLYYNFKLTHYHFLWDIRNRRIIGKRGKQKMISNKANFPFQCFYSETRNQIYSFYRQGECFLVQPDRPHKFGFQKIINKDLGQMIMFGGECLIVRSSDHIYFFKQIVDKMTKIETWQLFHEIRERAFIYYIKGNIRIQLTTEKLVFFYIINKETFMPELENVMYNYMGCSQMMFGKRVRYGITYKTNQRSFDVYKRKYMHNLKVCVDNDEMEGAFGVSMPSIHIFLVAKDNWIKIFDSNTFEQHGSVPIKLLVTETREPNEIIGVCKSKNDRFIAAITGKNLVMNNQIQNQIFFFKIEDRDQGGYPNFVQFERIVVKEIPFFQGVCMQYQFIDFPEGEQPTEMLFCKATEIFKFNIVTKEFKTIHKFKTALLQQPQYYCTSLDQKTHCLASLNDGIWFSERTKEEVDIDQLFEVDIIKNIIFDEEDRQFYFLSNKKKGFIGFYLLKFNEADPYKFQDLTMWKHRLDIDNCQLVILRGQDPISKSYYKELVISYKTIYINTFNVVVQDISGPVDKRATLYNHESFQLWESKITGLVLQVNKDFISLSKSGINVLALGSLPKKVIRDNEGQDKMIHSLDSTSFLKKDALNYIKYESQDYDNRVISIEQEYQKAIPGLKGQFETHSEPIYKIKISEITLRELLILQSFYLCKTQQEIVDLVKLQPCPGFFYKAFLELDLATMVSILAFDSASIAALLGDHNKDYFNPKYPIIYKNKIPKKHGRDFYYRTAIDNALRNNQVQSVDLMVNYVVQYQNNFTSADLFYKQILIMLEKGIECHKLFNSKIFQSSFEFDEWPSNHKNNMECIRAYNGSLYQLRKNYREVFPEHKFQSVDLFQHSHDPKEQDNQKVYKIKFEVNLLATIGEHKIEDPDDPGSYIWVNEGKSLMELAAESEEMEIFNSDQLNNLIQYKWNQYGQKHHIFGSFMHAFYTFSMITFVCKAYLYPISIEHHFYWTILLFSGIVYPWIYDLIQLVQDGPRAYFGDPWNYIDFIYIYGSLLNIYFQIFYGQFNLRTEILMCIIIILLIIKTFFFLRIIESYTPIVIMLVNVIWDLKVFLLFYFILLEIYCLLFCVIGVGLNGVQPNDATITSGQDLTDSSLTGLSQTNSTNSSLAANITATVINTTLSSSNTTARLLAPINGTDIQNSFIVGAGKSFLQSMKLKTQSNQNARGEGGDIFGLRVEGGVEENNQPNLNIPQPYQYVGMLVGSFIWTFRLSLGDYDLIGQAATMPTGDNIMFWLVWTIAMVLTQVIFLNFIIAEASNSYNKVIKNLAAIRRKERVSLLTEAEQMTRQHNKSETDYPPYLIVRAIEH